MSNGPTGYVAPQPSAWEGHIASGIQEKAGWIRGGSEMRELIRSHNWTATPLGPIEFWPQSLKIAVGIMLAARSPALVLWGDDFVCLYNDAYAASLTPEKHPSALGRSASGVWPEAYSLIEPELKQIMAGGEAIWHENRLVPTNRGGRIEEVYWTYSCGPIHDGDAPHGVGGVLVLLTETTRAVVSLRESEERYRSLIEHSSEGIWLLEIDPPIDISLPDEKQIELAYRNGRFVECNDAMARMYGLTRAEDLIGKTLDFPMPADDPEAQAYFAAIIRSNYRLIDVESVEQDASGNRKHFANSMIGVVENGRLKRIWGIQRDITDRKWAEEQRTLLINELNHRVKNTLATVQSIAAQTLRNAKAPMEAREAFESRLFALSRTHDVLTRENWEGADLRDIAEQAIAPYVGRGECRLHVSGPSVRMPPRMALPLAMALQELATNAVKYGALSDASGEIRITWRIEQGEPDRLHLRWEESGGPSVQTPTRRGFGSRLIERSLTQDLNGTSRIEFHPTGIVCIVDAPLV